MKKRFAITLAGLLLLIVVISSIKALQIRKMIDAGSQFVPPPEPVTTAEVTAASWEILLPAVGSLTAVQGVIVSAELPGKVVEIAFTGGDVINKGDLLLRQDTSTEQARLPGAEAELNLARQNLSRFKSLMTEELVTRAQLDAEQASFQLAQAAVDDLRSQIEKKTIRAPFSGRLGIRMVNLGQILREGDEIVSLQTLDPLFVDFQLPQQHMGQLRRGLPVRVTADGMPGRKLSGEVTAVNPQVNVDTRTIGVQATLPNRDELLQPGMFVTVEVALPDRHSVLLIPATAVLYAPFGDSVFIVEERQAEDGGRQLNLRQQFIRPGEKRGDFVNVLSGLKSGQTVVSTGVFKLRNGQAVIVDNSLSPEFRMSPQPGNT